MDLVVVQFLKFTLLKKVLLLLLQIRLSLEDSLSYRITSVHSHDLCVCSNEAKSVNFGIVPKVLGQVPLSLFAKDVNNSSVCGKDSAQMHLGVRDAVIRKLLVEVGLSLGKKYLSRNTLIRCMLTSICIGKYHPNLCPPSRQIHSS